MEKVTKERDERRRIKNSTENKNSPLPAHTFSQRNLVDGQFLVRTDLYCLLKGAPHPQKLETVNHVWGEGIPINMGMGPQNRQGNKTVSNSARIGDIGRNSQQGYCAHPSTYSFHNILGGVNACGGGNGAQTSAMSLIPALELIPPRAALWVGTVMEGTKRRARLAHRMHNSGWMPWKYERLPTFPERRSYR